MVRRRSREWVRQELDAASNRNPQSIRGVTPVFGVLDYLLEGIFAR